MVYLGTSVLGSYYCPESLSAVVSAKLAGAGVLSISSIVELEFLSLVGLKTRTRELTIQAGRDAIDLFRSHISAGMFDRIEIGQAVYALAERWLGMLSTPLRTLDSLHLAWAQVYDLELWTTDKKLAASANLLSVKNLLISR